MERRTDQAIFLLCGLGVSEWKAWVLSIIL